MARALSSAVNQALRLRLAVQSRQALFHELTEDDYLPLLARARGPISTKALRALTPAKFALAEATQALARATPDPDTPTPEESIARETARRAGLPLPLTRAEQRAATRRPPPTEYLGRLHSIPLVSETGAGVGSINYASSARFTIPMIVRRIQISTTATLGNTLEVFVFTTTSDSAVFIAGMEADRLFPNPEELSVNTFFVVEAAGAPITIPMAQQVSILPFFVSLLTRNLAAGPFRTQVVVTLQEGEADYTQITRVIVPQFVRAPGIPARPAAPRITGPPTSPLPRGVTIKVLSRGQPIFSRDIAWPSLDVNLKREFLNAQLSGNYPPTMQPIW